MSIAQSIIAIFLIPALKLYMWIIIARIVLSWLVAFNIVNLRNPLMAQVYQAVDAITEPVMRRFRRLIPNIGGLDLSPILIFLTINWLVWFLGAKIFPLLA